MQNVQCNNFTRNYKNSNPLFWEKKQHTQNASKAFDRCNYLLLFTKLIDIYCDSIYC